MKKLTTTLVFLALFVFHLQGQDYLIANYSNQTLSTSTGTLYDSGGDQGWYYANENFTMTISPSVTGAHIRLDFEQWDLDPHSQLEIFDGPDTNANSLGVYNQFNSLFGHAIGASASNAGGAITLRWTSGGIGQGFKAQISLDTAYQVFQSYLFSSTPGFTMSGGKHYIRICLGDTVHLHAKANFTMNNSDYSQNDNNTKFYWDFGNGIQDSGQSTQITYSQHGEYNIRLYAEDTLGFINQSSPKIFVRTSLIPDFTGTHIQTPALCIGDSSQLIGHTDMSPYQVNHSYTNTTTTYLPDGSGVSYYSTININSYPHQQSITSSNQQIRLCANIEHSYMGDLDIKLTCPNGQSVNIKSYPGGSGTFLGEPIDNNANQVPGLGFDYCWSSQGTTTMLNAAGLYSRSYVDVNGNPYQTNNFLPPSTSYPPNSTTTMGAGSLPIVEYLPETSFMSLVGCPFNGDWELAITDNLNIDNGFIFSWSLELDTAGSVPVTSYTPWVTDSSWSSTQSISGGDYALATTSGVHDYTYSVTDNFGCTYDTTVQLTVWPKPLIDLPSDTMVCLGYQILFDAGAQPGWSYLWSTQDTTPYIYVNSNTLGTGTHPINLSVTDTNQCTAEHTINLLIDPCNSINSPEYDQLFSVFPNPTQGSLQLQRNTVAVNETLSVILLSSLGDIISHSEWKANESELRLNVEDLANGHYYLKIVGSEEVLTKRFIKF